MSKNQRLTLYVGVLVVLAVAMTRDVISPLLFVVLAFAGAVICIYPEHLYSFVNYLHRTRQYGKLLAVCNHGLWLIPDNPHFIITRTSAYFETGRMAEAAQDAERALQLAPKMWQSWTNSGTVALMQCDYDRAVSDLEHALEIAPNSVHALHLRAMVKYMRLDPEGCLADIHIVREKMPNSPKLALMTVGSLMLLSRFDEAKAELDKFSSKPSLDADEKLALALYKLNVNQFADVLEVCSSVNEKDPGASSFLHLQSLAYRNLNEGALALQTSAREIERNSQNSHGYEVTACVLADAGRLDQALELCQRKEVAEKSRGLRSVEAHVRFRRGEFAEMLACTEASLSRLPEVSRVNAHHSLALAGLNRLDEAEQFAKKAISLHDIDAQAWYALADVQMKRGQTAEAIASLDKALAADPHDRYSYIARSEAHRRAGNIPNSEADEAQYEKLQAQFIAGI